MSTETKTYTRDELLNALRGKPAPYITFTKVDGEQRRMWCTLNDTYIPDASKPKNEKPLKENDSVIRVFDLDKQEWRSFRVENVTKLDYIVTAYGR